mmetsp:Transcript_3027/g.7403  ORF Transcript_3027/g.7403 Transcript_3027/m.7403 type:complete len:225 (+) Transcript_3027:1447-2121(+)
MAATAAAYANVDASSIARAAAAHSSGTSAITYMGAMIIENGYTDMGGGGSAMNTWKPAPAIVSTRTLRLALTPPLASDTRRITGKASSNAVAPYGIASRTAVFWASQVKNFESPTPMPAIVPRSICTQHDVAGSCQAPLSLAKPVAAYRTTSKPRIASVMRAENASRRACLLLVSTSSSAARLALPSTWTASSSPRAPSPPKPIRAARGAVKSTANAMASSRNT